MTAHCLRSRSTKSGPSGAPAEGFDAQAAGAGEQVENAAFPVLLDRQDVKNRRPHPFGGGTDSRSHRASEPPPPGLPAAYAHGSDKSKLYKPQSLAA